MRALHFVEHGETANLAFGEMTLPRPGVGEVLVEVRAAALNHLDLFVLRGMPGIPIELPHIGGADGAGIVAAAGEGASGWRAGDEVVINPGLWCGKCESCACGEESECVHFGILGERVNGTFAEFVNVPAKCLASKPVHLSWPEAAAFPLTFLTAWRMLVTRARLRPGETVLIHGIGGGVAVAALAMAKRMGATVLVTSSSDDKLSRAREMGADVAMNYVSVDVAKEVRTLTGKRGVDVVVDTIGQATWTTSLKCAAKGGRIVTCGATSGANPSEEIRLVFWKELSILGSTMGNLRDWLAMLRALRAWQLRPVIDVVSPLEEGRQAYEYLASGRQLGKVVLAVSPATAGLRESAPA